MLTVMQSALSQGVTLNLDHEKSDHFILMPVAVDMDIDLTILDAELAERGVERMEEEECEFEFVDSSIKVYLVETSGGL